MEPLTFFALAIGFIGVFHLLSTAITAVSKGRHAGVAATTKKRDDDWYCFFKLSNLLGRSDIASENTAQPDLYKKDSIEKIKRQREARRPRLHIS